MADVAYVALTVLLFGLLAVVLRGLERLVGTPVEDGRGGQ